MAENVQLQEQMAETAEQFSRQLRELAAYYDDRFAQVVRKTVLDLFGNIVLRSPVRSGSYRASHGIANSDPGPKEGIVKLSPTGNEKAAAADIARKTGRAWTWQVGDGDIFLFNNLPYAEPLENGHSKQAPQGVYRQAMTEITGVMKKQITALQLDEVFGGAE